MIIKDNMANMCAKVTSTYMEFTLAFGPKPEFSFSFKFISVRRVFILQKSVDRNKCSIYNQNKHSKIKTGDYGMIKLLSACSCCGHIFGRSADGTRTELRCPKCGAEMEYCVTGDTVTVRVLKLSEKQKERMKGK